MKASAKLNPCQDNFWLTDIHSQKLWQKPPSPSFNVDFLRFRPARCTRQPSEQFQTIFHTFSTVNKVDEGWRGGHIFQEKKGLCHNFLWLIVAKFWMVFFLVLFCFWKNVLFNSYVARYVIYSCRKTFKQPFTDVLQNRCS